jgi:hypothetical protein
MIALDEQELFNALDDQGNACKKIYHATAFCGGFFMSGNISCLRHLEGSDVFYRIVGLTQLLKPNFVEYYIDKPV